MTTAARPVLGGGLLAALLSAAVFGTSGSFAWALLDAGWSPGAAVTVRISGAAVVLAVPAAIALRGRWHRSRRRPRSRVGQTRRGSRRRAARDRQASARPS